MNDKFFLLEPQQREMVSEVESYFSELITAHTAYQIKHFIIGQFITPDRMHRQAIRELYGRVQGLVGLHYDYQKLQLEIKRLGVKVRRLERDGIKEKDELKKEEMDIEIREAEIELEQKKWAEMNLRKQASEVVREMEVFKTEADRLKTMRKYETYEEAEPEYWEKQYLNLRMQGKVGEGLPPIPEDQKIEIENNVRDQIESSGRRRFIDAKRRS